MITINRNPTDRDLRLFAALGAVLLLGLSLWLHLSRQSLTASAALRFVAIALVLVALIRPGWLRPIYVGWMLALYPLGWVIGHLFLAVVYFGVLTPIGLMLRVVGHDPLQLHVDPACRTMWQPRKTQRQNSDYFRQY